MSTNRGFLGWRAQANDQNPAFIIYTSSTDKAIKNKTSAENGEPYGVHNLHQSMDQH